jgi:hypothetical protein
MYNWGEKKKISKKDMMASWIPQKGIEKAAARRGNPNNQ